MSNITDLDGDRDSQIIMKISVSIWICFAYCYDFVYVDADMAKKGVDCVKIIQSFYAMMEDMIEKSERDAKDILKVHVRRSVEG